MALCLGACSGAATTADGARADPGSRSDLPGVADAATRADAGAPDAACGVGASSCVDVTHQRICRQSGWVVESCPAGALCLAQRCSAECTDECDLGQTRSSGGTTETCRLFSVAKNAAATPGEGMHDRARRHNAWLRKHHLPAGGLNDATFTGTGYTQVAGWGGTGDSALWTGAYLAAEALRHKATGSPDAQQNLHRVVEYVHRLFTVAGHKGYMVRYAAPLPSGDPRVDALYLKNNPDYFAVQHQGKGYFYRGATSRDAYQGPLLGLALAYPQLTSEPHRQLIREVVVDLCTELIKERKGVKISVSFFVNGQWINLPFSADLQYVVLNPDEYVDGVLGFTIGSPENPTDLGESSVRGVREFFPDFAVFVKQVPLLGALITFPIYRSGSTIMLASILRLGMLVTDGVPAYAKEHADIAAHYAQHIGPWLQIMKQYTFTNTQCWEKYYGLNISLTPMLNLIQLETDPALRASLHGDVLAAKMWPYVKDHKNVWFSYIYASSAPAGTAAQQISEAGAQLALFPPPPNVDRSIDSTGKYPANPSCPGQSSVAVDTSDRWADYFCWQKHPFYLKHEGDPLHVWPGVDYLLPYWLARSQGYLPDDAAGTCLRWQP